MRGLSASFSFALLALASACTASEFSSVCTIPESGTREEKFATVCNSCQSGIAQLAIRSADRTPRDILFVVQNTPGMVAKQQALAQVVSKLVSTMEWGDFDTRIGIVSTDVGSWTAAATPWTMSAGACDSFEGDDGRLQAVSCLDRSNVSGAAAAACSAVCPDRKFVPNDGHPFLIRKNGKYNVPVALALDPMTGRMIDRGPEYALKCMLALGDGGCNVSSPLDSMRRALDGHRAENRDFVRPGIPLLIIFLTDGDDCSVQLARRGDNAPQTQDCSPPDPNAPASCYSLGAYRCLARDVVCDQPMNVAGQKSGCRERADTYLTSVDSYVQFLRSTLPQTHVEIGGIWSIPSLQAGGKLVVAQNPRVAGSAGLDFGQGSDAGCQAAGDPAFTGQAQLRLSQLAAAFEVNHAAYVTSVCEPSKYDETLRNFGTVKLLGYGLNCLPGPPKSNPDGSPSCMIGDVPEETPSDNPKSLLSQCSARCCEAYASRRDFSMPRKNPGIQEGCRDEPADCYCARPSEYECQGGAIVSVWRKDGADDPPGQITSVRCGLQCPMPAR